MDTHGGQGTCRELGPAFPRPRLGAPAEAAGWARLGLRFRTFELKARKTGDTRQKNPHASVGQRRMRKRVQIRGTVCGGTGIQ